MFEKKETEARIEAADAKSLQTLRPKARPQASEWELEGAVGGVARAGGGPRAPAAGPAGLQDASEELGKAQDSPQPLDHESRQRAGSRCVAICRGELGSRYPLSRKPAWVTSTS